MHIRSIEWRLDVLLAEYRRTHLRILCETKDDEEEKSEDDYTHSKFSIRKLGDIYQVINRYKHVYDTVHSREDALAVVDYRNQLARFGKRQPEKEAGFDAMTKAIHQGGSRPDLRKNTDRRTAQINDMKVELRNLHTAAVRYGLSGMFDEMFKDAIGASRYKELLDVAEDPDSGKITGNPLGPEEWAAVHHKMVSEFKAVLQKQSQLVIDVYNDYNKTHKNKDDQLTIPRNMNKKIVVKIHDDGKDFKDQDMVDEIKELGLVEQEPDFWRTTLDFNYDPYTDRQIGINDTITKFIKLAKLVGKPRLLNDLSADVLKRYHALKDSKDERGVTMDREHAMLTAAVHGLYSIAPRLTELSRGLLALNAS